MAEDVRRSALRSGPSDLATIWIHVHRLDQAVQDSSTAAEANPGAGSVSPSPRRSVAEVLRVFLRLGLTSFGGPIAHLGYYHREFVVRRRWLDQSHYTQLLAPSQFLPGPSSTQFGFSVGLLRAGWRGALAAFLAFTLPSALLMFAFAEFSPALGGPYGEALLHGLKLMAVAVVAQGILAMARTLTPDWPRLLLAMASLALIVGTGSGWSQI